MCVCECVCVDNQAYSKDRCKNYSQDISSIASDRAKKFCHWVLKFKSKLININAMIIICKVQ